MAAKKEAEVLDLKSIKSRAALSRGVADGMTDGPESKAVQWYTSNQEVRITTQPQAPHLYTGSTKLTPTGKTLRLTSRHLT
jgi:hypothetical protein